MRQIYTILFLLTLSIVAFGQNERKFVRNGNKLFMQAVKDTTKVDSIKFSNAETEYLKALEKRPDDLQWNYNLADALYKQQRFKEAESKFTDLAEKMKEPVERARANHNLGNTQLMQEKLDESIESYKKALRENPSDIETKYNLAYAQMLKKKKEEQEKQNQDQNKDQDKDQDKDKDQDQDQNKDQNKDNQDKNQDQNKDQQKQNQDQNKNQDQQDKDQQQKQQPQQNKISKQDAEQLLQALQNDERDIQDKVKKEKAAKAKRSKSEKEW